MEIGKCWKIIYPTFLQRCCLLAGHWLGHLPPPHWTFEEKFRAHFLWSSDLYEPQRAFLVIIWFEYDNSVYVCKASLIILLKVGMVPNLEVYTMKEEWNGAKRHSWGFLFLQKSMGFAESPWPHRMGEFSTDSSKGKHKSRKVISHRFVNTLVLKWAYWGKSHPISHCDGRECTAPSFGWSAIIFTAVVGAEELPKKAMCSMPGTELSFCFCSVKFSESPYLLAG